MRVALGLRNRDVRLLLLGGTVSQLGSMLLVVAVPYQVFRVTGSTVATSLALALEAVPAILVGPWAGALVDRWHRRTVLILANLGAAAGVALMLCGTTPDRLPLLYLGLVAEQVAAAFLRPASTALLPAVAGTGPDLAAANSAFAFAVGVVRLAGPPLGTLLLSVGGFGAAVAADVASYLVPAALTVALQRIPTPRRTGTGAWQVARELRDGVRTLAGSRLLRGMLATTWAYWTANAALTALLVPFVVRRLHSPGQDVGYLVSALGVGYLVGSAASRLVVGRHPTRTVLAGAYLAVGAAFLGMFHAPSLPVAAAFTALAGVPGAIAMVATQHRIQADVDGTVLGRVSAGFATSDALAAVTGAALAPACVALVGLGGTLTVFSVVVVVTAAAVPLLLPRP